MKRYLLVLSMILGLWGLGCGDTESTTTPSTTGQQTTSQCGEAPGAPCTNTNSHGTCAGTWSCDLDVAVCSAAEPALESCGGGDENCNGQTDEANAEGCELYHRDDDGDGYGVEGDTRCLCSATAPYTATQAGDCNDAIASINPGAEETCNATDDDCDDVIDQMKCDDGSACTTDEFCTLGECIGVATQCADDNPCTLDTCDPDTGECTFSNDNSLTCSDNDACTVGDQCSDGVCVAGSAAKCDDGNPCTQGTCKEGIGCLYTSLSGECDDGDACTQDDECLDGVCSGTTIAGCGSAVCGDGVCSGNEDCATCSLDCSPIGAGSCGKDCDPLVANSCDAGFACIPTNSNGTLNTDAFLFGNGVCGNGCSQDSDCANGTCALVEGLNNTGFCTTACTSDGNECAQGSTCITPTDEAKEGYCGLGSACKSTDAEACSGNPGSYCTTLKNSTNGSCTPKCWTSNAKQCGEYSCLSFSAPSYHQGICVGDAVQCNAVTQDGCKDNETCALVADTKFFGQTSLCKSAGSAKVFDSCTSQTNTCGPGLICIEGMCRKYCDLKNPQCGAGGCKDLSEASDVPPELIGFCVGGCGDGVCASNENCDVCAKDCAPCESVCGNGVCDNSEDCTTCSDDCGACMFCGDGQCNNGENCQDCAKDCPPDTCGCGDGVCTQGEDCGNCEKDCGQCLCGDGTCTLKGGENCDTCSQDCGSCKCGDGACTSAENCATCESDCGACQCGDGNCDPTENCDSCPNDCGECTCGDVKCTVGETCENCAQDCGFCPCGDGICQSNEDCVECPGDCGKCACGDGQCNGNEECETCPADCPCNCGDGECSENETCQNCPADCGPLAGMTCKTDCVPSKKGADCPENHACFPSQNGKAWTLGASMANGVCAEACSSDKDCLSGSCSPISQASASGVCGLTTSCDSNASICIAAIVGQCVATPNGKGACLPTCSTFNPSGCEKTCIKRNNAPDVGLCVGPASACDPTDPLACPNDNVCHLLYAPGVGGAAFACTPVTETNPPGAACSALNASCTAGNICVDEICQKACNVALPNCTGGTSCKDISAHVGLTAGTVGVCK